MNVQFGHFDDERKEYVITTPDASRSWSNYLGPDEAHLAFETLKEHWHSKLRSLTVNTPDQ